MVERLTDEQRRDYLAMAMRRTRPGAGSSEHVLRQRSARYGTPALRRYLPGIRFAVVGGLATRLYMPERMTLDADILVSMDTLDRVEEALDGGGSIRRGALSVGGSTWSLPDGTPLDVIALPDPWVETALDTAVSGPGSLPYVTLPYLVLMKLAAGRVQDLADITRMLGAAPGESLAAVRAAVQRFRPRDIDDVESMVRLGRMEIGVDGP
jgi:hypothetical protein